MHLKEDQRWVKVKEHFFFSSVLVTVRYCTCKWQTPVTLWLAPQVCHFEERKEPQQT